MLFNSLEFFVFLGVVWALYLVLRHRAQNRMLLAASYLFYGAWDWRFLGLLIASTVIDYWVAAWLARIDDPGRRRTLIVVSMVANLGILAFFKYAAFFADGLADLLALVGLTLPPFVYEIVLPVGISFYTFQTMSYTIDVYRKKLEPARSLEDFALFVAFFPQLVAGPIERATNLLPQIVRPRSVTWEGVKSGSWLILSGTFKKVVLADNVAFVVSAVFAEGQEVTPWEIVLGCWCFAWQIYGDFSGYSDVARGTARLLGFELMLNFNLPWLSTSPADFWRRWHISLSTWLRDYLFIPLGGSHGSATRTQVNLALTLLLAGLWHGASWNKVLWGAFMAAIVVAHRASLPLLERVRPVSLLGRSLWWLLRVTVTFHLFAVSWLIFVPTSLARTGELFTTLAGPWDAGMASAWLLPFAVLVIPVLVLHAIQVRSRDLECVIRWPFLLRAGTYAVVFLAVVFLGEDFGLPFFYFQF